MFDRILNMPFIRQFLLFKLRSYCFEETIGFDVKVLFASRLVSRQTRFLRKGYSVPRDFSWIENHKLKMNMWKLHLLKYLEVVHLVVVHWLFFKQEQENRAKTKISIRQFSHCQKILYVRGVLIVLDWNL